jgi:hypothetical protein
LKINPARGANGGLIVSGHRIDMFTRNTTVGHVRVGRIDVDMIEQILLHESPIRVNALRRHRVVFVKIEGDDPAKTESVFAVHPNQFPVHANRRGAGREAEHGMRTSGASLGDDVGNSAGDRAGKCLVAVEHHSRNLLEAGRGVEHMVNLLLIGDDGAPSHNSFSVKSGFT